MTTTGCIFCGAVPLTREHLWPDWLRRELEIKQPFPHRIEQERDGVETRDVSFETPPFNQTVKAVCAACNGGWMSEIEAAAKPLLQSLIRAEGRRLDRGEQRVLAQWAFLKACVFDELHPQERVVPAAHRQYLYAHKEPPAEGVWIRLATYEALEIGHYAQQGLLLARHDGPAPTEPNVYFVTITVGALVVLVTGSLLEDWSFADLPFLLPEFGLAEIWPTSASVEFAQRTVMTHDTLVAFTKLLYNVIGRRTGVRRPRDSAYSPPSPQVLSSTACGTARSPSARSRPRSKRPTSCSRRTRARADRDHPRSSPHHRAGLPRLAGRKARRAGG